MSNKKTKIEVTLLSKEEVEGKSKVLQKAGRECKKFIGQARRRTSTVGTPLVCSA